MRRLENATYAIIRIRWSERHRITTSQLILKSLWNRRCAILFNLASITRRVYIYIYIYTLRFIKNPSRIPIWLKKKKKKKRNEFVRINFYIHFAQRLIRWQKRYFNVSWDRMKFQRFGPLYSKVAFAFVTSTIRILFSKTAVYTRLTKFISSVYIFNPWSPRISSQLSLHNLQCTN